MDRTNGIRIFDNFTEEAARFFTDWVQEQRATKETLHVALTGGSTPRPFYERLAASPCRERLDFPAMHFYMGDERPVPPDHPESNWGMATRTLLDPAGVPRENRHPMRAGDPDLHQAARDYVREIRAHVPAVDGLPAFDMILLGLGTDGHTASLFPCTAALEETRRLVVANAVPALETTRLTFTCPLINNARHVVFLVTGASKAAVVQRVLIARDATLPATQVRPTHGRLTWLLDREASPSAG